MTPLFFAVTLLILSLGQAQSLPSCDYKSLPTTHQGYEAWQRTLLDPLYKLTETYAPPDLISTTQIAEVADKQIRSIMAEDLKALLDGAEQNGTPLDVQSAYRSYAYQESTFKYWVDLEGEAAALKSSARAGHSEHQLGTAIDFKSHGGPAPWDLEDWAETPAGAWLAQNAYRYGFVMSYPEGKESVTCYIYEPWHYRYLGRETAAQVKESGLTLREWLWLQQ